MTEGHSNADRGAESNTAPRVPREAIIGGVILALCLVAYAITLTFKEAPAALAMNVQPSTFPRMVIAVIGFFAAIMVVMSFGHKDDVLKPVHIMSFLSAGMMLAFVFVFSTLGIIPAMVLLCFFLPVLWGERRWKIIVPYCVLFPAAVYVLFAIILNVHFDSSPLAFW